jgi:hypothetical protein
MKCLVRWSRITTRMPRQRMAPGEHGQINQKSSGGRFFASTYVRGADGKRRRVERSSTKSAEDARRLLQRHLAERRTPLSGQLVNDRTTLAELFKIWLAAKVFETGFWSRRLASISRCGKSTVLTSWARSGLQSCRPRGRTLTFRLSQRLHRHRPGICGSSCGACSRWRCVSTFCR